MPISNAFKNEGQWLNPKAEKLVIPFSAFQPNATKEGLITVLKMPSCLVPHWIQIVPNIQFGGNGITKAELTVTTDLNGIPEFDPNFVFAKYDLRTVASINAGLAKPITRRFINEPPNDVDVILSRSTDVNIYLNLLVNNNKVIDDLQNGEFTLWLSFFTFY